MVGFHHPPILLNPYGINSILKHRSGDLGVVNLRFEGKYVRFSNPPTFTVDSKMNTDIKPNESFDNPVDATQESGYGLPPEEDL